MVFVFLRSHIRGAVTRIIAEVFVREVGAGSGAFLNTLIFFVVFRVRETLGKIIFFYTRTSD
jgi:hypothetical protein